MLFLKRNREDNNDVVLVEQFLTGNKRAETSLHTFVERLTERAIRTLENKGTSFRDRENIKQDIIVAIMVNNDSAILRRYKGESALSTYLWSVIRYKLIDALRREMLMGQRTEPIHQRDIPGDNDESSRELYNLIDRFLQDADEKDAFVMKMRWLEERSYAEICQKALQYNITVSISYIGNLLFKKRTQLLQYLKKHGFDFDKQVEISTTNLKTKRKNLNDEE